MSRKVIETFDVVSIDPFVEIQGVSMWLGSDVVSAWSSRTLLSDIFNTLLISRELHSNVIFITHSTKSLEHQRSNVHLNFTKT